jgi:hypothetical protein
VINQSHDPTGQGAGLASDTELDEQREAVVVDAFANEVGAVVAAQCFTRRSPDPDRTADPRPRRAERELATFAHHVTCITF